MPGRCKRGGDGCLGAKQCGPYELNERNALKTFGEDLVLLAQKMSPAMGKSCTFLEQVQAQSRIDIHTMLIMPWHRIASRP